MVISSELPKFSYNSKYQLNYCIGCSLSSYVHLLIWFYFSVMNPPKKFTNFTPLYQSISLLSPKKIFYEIIDRLWYTVFYKQHYKERKVEIGKKKISKKLNNTLGLNFSYLKSNCFFYSRFYYISSGYWEKNDREYSKKCIQVCLF